MSKIALTSEKLLSGFTIDHTCDANGIATFCSKSPHAIILIDKTLQWTINEELVIDDEDPDYLGIRYTIDIDILWYSCNDFYQFLVSLIP